MITNQHLLIIYIKIYVGRTWKKVVVAYFAVLSQLLSGVTEKEA
jgi:hypothetical protein